MPWQEYAGIEEHPSGMSYVFDPGHFTYDIKTDTWKHKVTGTRYKRDGTRIGEPLKNRELLSNPMPTIGALSEKEINGFLDIAQNLKNTNILEKASKLIYGDRQSDYGSVTDNFDNIAKLWSMVVGVSISPEQVALMMIGVKYARLSTNIGHEDSWLDIAGYVGCKDKLSRGE